MTSRTPKPGALVPNDLAQTLAHHDAAINNLSGRMTGVETSLVKLHDNMGVGFTEITNKLATLDATKPPSMMHQIAMVSTVFGIAGMIVWGITYVATSVMQPEIVHLKNATTFVSRSVDRRNEDEIAELKDYRKEERESFRKELVALREKYGWLARTVQAPAKKPAN